MRNDLLGAIAAVVGEKNVLVGEQESAPYLTDWRKQFRGPAVCVVRPGATAEVSAVVRACAQAGVAIVPQGGNTGLTYGGQPGHANNEVVVSTVRMKAIREIDLLNDTITVEAGVVLQEIQRTAAEKNRLFPLSLGAEGTCQIGGNISTNAGGIQVLRYGNTRNLILGLEVVLPDGRVWDGLRGLR
jgi:FAD/FMN-containing dehydrogenase